MSHSLRLPDFHDLRVALQANPSSRPQVLEDSARAAQNPACRHVFIQDPAPALMAAARLARENPVPVVQLPLPLAGIPVSIKDLFDVEGEVTAAGSTVLTHHAAATADCPAVARLRQAGAVIAGRTNMVEFAFSGVGINPHYGTPANPADADIPRIPGGSSSGAAVAVATGASWLGLGSDTGGSLRIPAALCGLVGFKGTARLVPTEGAVPLSTTLDTVGALTRSVRDAVVAHEVLAARKVRLAGKPLSACRLAVAGHLMQDGLDPEVAKAFERSLKILRQAGAHIEDIPLVEIGELPAINATGGLSAAESYAWHRSLMAQHQHEYDPRVALRILRGAAMSAADYIDLVAARRGWIARMDQRLQGFDAVISPTVPLVAPPIAALLHDDTEFFRVNALLLRNTSIVNMLDGCALSLPCHTASELPVGLMLWHGAMRDDGLLDLSLQVEAALRAAHSHH